jgi:hypothetical protein
MENQVQDMLNKGVIEESNSPWNAPAIIDPMKSLDGKPKYRFRVDFRALNTVTHFDTYPLPLIEQASSALHGSKYFSAIDMYSGFWQVKMASEDKMKTTFSTPSGHYHFQGLPYGLSNSPSIFQRLMDVVLRNLTGELCFVFIDDILVFVDTIEEHARRLDEVLQRFGKANLLLQQVLPQVNYLVYVVSQDGVTAYPEKVLAFRKYPVPKNVKEVRCFLRLGSFYRRVVLRFSEIAKTMTQLIRKDTQFKWESSQQAAFEKLKEVICSEHVLAYPDFKSQFILTTDASKVTVAAVLSQVQDGVERPVAFESNR